MSALDPTNTTAGDVVLASLKLAGVIGTGQSASAEDTNDVWALLQWMLQEWERKRWLVYCLNTFNIISTGAQTYTLGPGGAIDTGAGTVRPDKIESAFVRQLQLATPNQPDWPLKIWQAKEDYNRVALKNLTSFPADIFYDPQWPLGVLYPWPLPQANVYGLYVTIKAQLPTRFASLATTFTLPYEYYNGIVFNLAMRCRVKYSIPTFPGDFLPGLAKDSLNTIRGANTAIAALVTPDLSTGRQYNIFSDRFQ